MGNRLDVVAWPIELAQKHLRQNGCEFYIRRVKSPYRDIDEGLTWGYVVRQKINEKGIHELSVCTKREGRHNHGIQNQ